MPLSSLQRNITNGLLTQGLWFACVLGGNRWALLAGVCYWLVYVLYIGNLKQEWRSILIIACTGFIIDLLLTRIGLLEFHSDFWFPFWLLVLWSGFATLFHHGLTWLDQKVFLGALLGAIAGPGAYFAGASLTNSNIYVSLPLFFSAYALLWAIYIPVFLLISRRDMASTSSVGANT